MNEQEIAKLVVRLKGDISHYEAALNQAKKEMQGLTGHMNSRLASVQSGLNKAAAGMRQFGSMMSMYVTAPILAIGGLAVREFAKFDQAMTESTSIMKTSGDQVQRMRDLALSLAKTNIQGPEELARSYFYLASAGLNAEESMAALPVVMRFATAGAFDMAKATDLLTDAQSALGLNLGTAAQKAKNMADLADVLVKANILANASVEQFSIALTSKAGSAMKAFGISMQEGVAVLAAMADQGIKAELAGNSFARLMTLLQKAAIDNEKAWRKYNFTIYNTDGSLRHMWQIIGDLERILGKESAQMKAVILDQLGFEARVQGVILPLLGTSKAIERYFNELKRANGMVDEVANKQLKSLSNQLKIAWNNIKVTSIALGENLAPALIKVVNAVSSLISAFGRMSDETQQVLSVFALVAAAAGPAIVALSVLTKATSMLLTAYTAVTTGAIVAGVTAYAVAILAAVAAAALLGNALYNAMPRVKQANELMAEYGRLHKQNMSNLERRQGQALGNIQVAETNAGKQRTVGTEIEGAKAQVRRYMRAVEDARKEVQKLESAWFTTQAEVDLANQRMTEAIEARNKAEQNLNELVKIRTDLENGVNIAAAEAAVKETERMEETRGKVDELTKSLQNQLDTFGMTGAEADIYALSLEGASEKELAAARNLDKLIKQREKHAQAMERGKQLMQQYLTPQEKLMQTQTELNDLLNKGAIDKDTYDRAMKDSQDEYDRAAKAAFDKGRVAPAPRQDNTAVMAGSAEFYRMLDRPDPTADDIRRTADAVEDMNDLLREDIADKNSDVKSEMAQANFFGGP